MKTLVTLATVTAVTTASDEAKAVVGPQTGDMRRGKRPFAKINWEVK